ncbi:MAG TPA: glycosyltransferase family 2 protein [Ilumatobacteraceae bacterium]|nr:glycosyltransferase family 2 protein [Ilumatobacteraceae bacterium]
MTPQLTVVIPAFNEQESLEATVKAVIAALPDPARSELVIVNDGSTDQTRAVAHAIADTCVAGVVVVVDRPTNGGMGQALASGLERATGDVITWIPGDGEYDLDEVLVGIDQLSTSDIVLVRRNSRGQVGRNIVSSIMYGLIRVLFGFDATGYCGIFVVSRARWQELTIRSRDVFFTLEVALRARHVGWNISYVTAEWRPRRAGRSKVFRPTVMLRNVIELFRFRIALWTAR